jgi:hypothetical protein
LFVLIICVAGHQRCRIAPAPSKSWLKASPYPTDRHKWSDCIGGLMPEQLFTQELFNSLFCPLCKVLRVLDGVSVGNINRRDP